MTFSRRSFLQSALAAAAAPAQAAPSALPNIILILADDMGFSDIGAYGSEIETPNLDRLAARGVRFTQFHSCARCCPSRASLLTGMYPHQAGIGHMVDLAGPAPGYVNDLNPRTHTIAEVLRGAGYQTGIAGKWHVTPVNDSKRNWPLQRGFDRYYGIIHGAADYFNPVTLVDGNETVTANDQNYYLTDAIGERAAGMIGDFAKRQDPFFLYAAFTAPHWPLHARPDDIRRFEGRYKMGWDQLRIERHERQLHAGMLSKRWNLTGRDSQVPAWNDATDKAWQSRRMEVYAAMVHRLDLNIGRMLDKLEETGRASDTMVLFMSDNGGCAEEITPTWTGRHIRARARDGSAVRVGNVATVMPGAEDTYQIYGVPWANASNTPFRLYKHWVHEGGIASPMLFSWPNRVKPSHGWIREPSHFIDVMATCADAAGAKLPDGNPPLEGRSLLPVLEHGKAGAERNLFWEHEGNRAMRRGRWKLVGKHPGDWELYDMDTDRTELHDLASSKPAIARAMAASYDEWAKRAGVLPWDDVRKQQHAR